MKSLAKLLNQSYEEYNSNYALFSAPDPLQIVKQYLNNQELEKIAFFCALFSYGNARAIMNFLSQCPLHSFEQQKSIKLPPSLCYRFQSHSDIEHFYQTILKIPHKKIYDTFYKSYKQHKGNIGILEGIRTLSLFFLQTMEQKTPLTYGIKFLLGNPNAKNSPYKRINLFLRWLVRCDNIDLGIWGDMISPRDLILPLDTHTFSVCRKLGIIKRKSYDLKSALEATIFFKKIHPHDPIRYDFALYRIGQQNSFMPINS